MRDERLVVFLLSDEAVEGSKKSSMTHSENNFILVFALSRKLLKDADNFFGAFHTLLHRFDMIKRKPPFTGDFSVITNLYVWDKTPNIFQTKSLKDILTLVDSPSFMNLDHQLYRHFLLIGNTNVLSREYGPFVSTRVDMVYLYACAFQPFTYLFTFPHSLLGYLRLSSSLLVIGFFANLTQHIVLGLAVAHYNQSHFI